MSTLTNKERNLLKGTINRLFSQSGIREWARAFSKIEYYDPMRPRVKNWSECAHCSKPTPEYETDIDHKIPRVPVDSNFADMPIQSYIDRTWCEIELLQALCQSCHTQKSSHENVERRLNKKKRKLK